MMKDRKTPQKISVGENICENVSPSLNNSTMQKKIALKYFFMKKLETCTAMQIFALIQAKTRPVKFRW